mmetsp:Transcript_50737/g.127857  ORF Transcript_50737/g.127857 Transcript_50737/m.127857 type:complete len:311 (-) Transcript_50737:121-1053(-)
MGKLRMYLTSHGDEDDAPQQANHQSPLDELLGSIKKSPTLGGEQLQQRQERLRAGYPEIALHLEPTEAITIKHEDKVVQRQADRPHRRAQRGDDQHPQQRPRAEGLCACRALGHAPEAQAHGQEHACRKYLELQAAPLINAKFALQALLDVGGMDLEVHGLHHRDTAGSESEVPKAGPDLFVDIDCPVVCTIQMRQRHCERLILHHLLAIDGAPVLVGALPMVCLIVENEEVQVSLCLRRSVQHLRQARRQLVGAREDPTMELELEQAGLSIGALLEVKAELAHVDGEAAIGGQHPRRSPACCASEGSDE